MTRHHLRRSLPRLESLEKREVMNAGGPSAEAQYMLERMNWARQNPAAAAQWVTNNLNPDTLATVNYYGVDLNAVNRQISSIPSRPPLAWNDNLAQAAQWQSQDQANSGVQSHTGTDGSTIDQRLNRFGYDNRRVDAENAYAYAQSVDHALEAFLIDWGVADQGHRKNIMQPDQSQPAYRSVGIGIVQTDKSNIGPMVITQDFGRTYDSSPYLLGTVYQDLTHDNFYQPGDGLGNVTVTATNRQTGASSSVQTWDAGGYQMRLTPGTYEIQATLNGQVIGNQTVQIDSENVQADFVVDRLPSPNANPTTPAVATPQVVSNPPVSTQPSQTVTNLPSNNPSSAPTPSAVVAVAIPTKATVTIPIASSSNPPVSTPWAWQAWSGSTH